MPLLRPGDTFPELTLTVPGEQQIPVPGSFADEFGVCCSTAGRGAPTAPPSSRRSSGPVIPWPRPASGWPRSGSTMRRPPRSSPPGTALTFPLGHSADARAVAGLTGAFVNEDPLYLQSTGFVLDQRSKVIVSVHSGPVG